MEEGKKNDRQGQSGESQGNDEMTFWGHLEVLRWSIMRVGIALVACMIGCFLAMPHIFDSFILGPASSDFFLYKWLSGLHGTGGIFPDFSRDFSVDIININVASQFTTHISTSFWLALVIVFPYLIYEIWKFISPALFPDERKNVRLAFFFGTFMFYLGCAVGYGVVFPFTFRFLTEYQVSTEIVNQISLNSYMGNFLMMVFVMGLVFEIPLLAWVLSAIGVVNKNFLKKYRRHAVVVLLILAAVITPTGDPFTLMVVFLPLYLLYELSIKVVRK
ncbi:MAG: twin-arginine translocase subunit TatC [Bacteroidetes bacterium]|uniref:Sec-independent protein translocase protein TatC n=1 Tax=Candidatus Cryptobacteroides merdavium TaxID=2840769 RepID=A0A9D9EI84_9BACT|nr:twin-arginine translocase subunit TatC [Candidatus Cryptobacteroides merdavium]